MDAVNPINPDALFTIKGADQSVYAFNGGQGFVTDETLVAETHSSNPNAFFRTLLAKSYANQVMLLIFDQTSSLCSATHTRGYVGMLSLENVKLVLVRYRLAFDGIIL